MRAPSAVVIGATDLDATTSFLAHFGFATAASSTLSAAEAHGLYGLDTPTATRLLITPGARAGHVSLVQTPHPAEPRGVFDHGPLALDIYTTDLDADLADLDRAGVRLGVPGRLELGPLVLRQVQVIAPDGWRLVLVEANHRRPSVLDTVLFKGRHSQVHSQLWTVPSLRTSADAWIAAGFEQTHVFPIAHPELSKILELPAPDTALRMNLLVGDDQDPVRVELVEFPGQPGADEPEDDLLRAGVHALWMTLTDLEGPLAAQLAGSRRVTAAGREGAVGRLGGVRVECWQADARPSGLLGRRRR